MADNEHYENYAVELTGEGDSYVEQKSVYEAKKRLQDITQDTIAKLGGLSETAQYYKNRCRDLDKVLERLRERIHYLRRAVDSEKRKNTDLQVRLDYYERNWGKSVADLEAQNRTLVLQLEEANKLLAEQITLDALRKAAEGAEILVEMVGELTESQLKSLKRDLETLQGKGVKNYDRLLAAEQGIWKEDEVCDVA